ncbi:MAG: hypothetical protein V1696_03245 [Candidatus Jorgensenbacteria bacterium]
MKDFFRIIKEYFILIIGIGLFTYGLFGFHADEICGEGSLMPAGTLPLQIFDRLKCIEPAIFYYYDLNALVLVTTGAILITIGLLKLKRKNSE